MHGKADLNVRAVAALLAIASVLAIRSVRAVAPGCLVSGIERSVSASHAIQPIQSVGAVESLGSRVIGGVAQIEA
jgi:hypothetical protein